MVFDKKVLQNLVLLIILALLFFVPGPSKWIKTQFSKLTMSSAEIEMHEDKVKLSSGDFNLDLKGIGTADTNMNQSIGKPVLINFWGSWCPPCVAEMPSLQKLYEAKKSVADFYFIARQDKPENIKNFMKKNHYSMPVYEAQSLISAKFITRELPTTYIIDKQGNIVLQEAGAADWNTEEVKALLDSLAQE